MIVRALRATARAVTGRTNAPPQAGGDFNREMTDPEISRIVGGYEDPQDYDSNVGRGWWEAADRDTALRIINAMRNNR